MNTLVMKRIALILLALLVVAFLLGGVLVRDSGGGAPVAEERHEQVDDATYTEVQRVTSSTPFKNPEVVRESLRVFDIDGDGDEDVLGFVKLAFRENYTDYKFTTWHRIGDTYDYYEDSYDDFRFNNKDLGCEIEELQVRRITISCTRGEVTHDIVLGYQQNGTGYYQDIEAQAKAFDTPVSWKRYESPIAGVVFRHPENVLVSEATYETPQGVRTIVRGMRDSKMLFEIHRVPHEGDKGPGGSLISASERNVFLKLADDVYLHRSDYHYVSNESRGSDYNFANINEVNNVGSRFASYDIPNVMKNSYYGLHSSSGEEETLLVDAVFSTLSFKDAFDESPERIITPKSTPVTFADTVTLTIPGNLKIGTTTGTLMKIETGFVESDLIALVPITLRLHPFGSVGGTSAIGGGGYDADKDECFGYEKEPREKVSFGEYEACWYGHGDAGISYYGYYIFHPERKYILELQLDASYNGYTAFVPDLEEIAKTVKFK